MSLIDKFTKDINDVDLHIRASLERKRSEVILRLSELDEAIKIAPMQSTNKTKNNHRTKTRMSGAQRRKLGIERAIAAGAPIRARKKKKPKDRATSGGLTRKSPSRISITRQISNPTSRDISDRREDTHRSHINPRSPRSLYPTSEKYPIVSTSNHPKKGTELPIYNSAAKRNDRRSRSYTNSKKTNSRSDDKDRIRDKRPNPDFRSTLSRDRKLSPIRRYRDRSIGRHNINNSPDYSAIIHSPGSIERNRDRRSTRSRSPCYYPFRNQSADRLGRVRSPGSPSHPITSQSDDRNRSLGHCSSRIVYGSYLSRDSNTSPDYYSRNIDRDSRFYDTSTCVDDFSADHYSYPNIPCNDGISTNYRNQLIERSREISDIDSRWHDTSRTIHSYSQSRDYRCDVDRNSYSNDKTIDNVTSLNSDWLRSHGLGYSPPLDINSRTNRDITSVKDVSKVPSNHTNTSSGGRSNGPPKVTTDSIRVTIVPVDYPNTFLTKSQANDIELALISHIKPGEAGTGPQFSCISFLQKTLVATCKNTETKHWLEDIVPKLRVPNVGPLQIFTTKSLIKSGKFTKVTMFVPNPIAREPVSKLLTLLKTQNIGVHTENWRILGRNKKPNGLSMALLIDDDSLATLEKLKLKACLGLSQAKFTILRGKRD